MKTDPKRNAKRGLCPKWMKCFQSCWRFFGATRWPSWVHNPFELRERCVTTSWRVSFLFLDQIRFLFSFHVLRKAHTNSLNIYNHCNGRATARAALRRHPPLPPADSVPIRSSRLAGCQNPSSGPNGECQRPEMLLAGGHFFFFPSFPFCLLESKRLKCFWLVARSKVQVESRDRKNKKNDKKKKKKLVWNVDNEARHTVLWTPPTNAPCAGVGWGQWADSRDSMIFMSDSTGSRACELWPDTG